MDNPTFNVSMKLLENYVFQIDFGDYGNLISDEPEPLGTGEGPNPVRLLAASVANCLAASLLFALRKKKDTPQALSAEVSGSLSRVEKRWRVTDMQVTLKLDHNSEELPHLQEALATFEDFCVVTQSVRQGIAVDVRVIDQSGKVLSSEP